MRIRVLVVQMLLLGAPAIAAPAPPCIPPPPLRDDPRVREADALRLEASTQLGGDAAARLARYERALRLEEDVYGKDDPRLLPTLQALRAALGVLADRPAVRRILERMRAIQERACGRQSREVAGTLAELAIEEVRLSRFERSEPLFQEANAIAAAVYGAESVELANFIAIQAIGYSANQDYARAAAVLARALAIVEKVAPDGAALLGPLSQLAYVTDLRGRTDESVGHYRRMLALAEKLYPGNAMLKASHLQGAAQALEHGGRAAEADAMRAEAQGLLEAALARCEVEMAGGPRAAIAQAEWSGIVSLLVGVYSQRGLTAKALPLALKKYERAVAQLGAERAALTEEPGLASLYEQLDDLPSARAHYEHLLVVQEKLVGRNMTFAFRELLANVERAAGRIERALTLEEEARSGLASFLGARHFRVASVHENEARLLLALGRRDEALAHYAEAVAITEPYLALLLGSGTEEDKRRLLDSVSGQVHAVVWLHVHEMPDDPRALRLAVTTLLRRKGRAIDAFANNVGALRRRLGPAEQQLLDELGAARAKLAALALGAPPRPSPEYGKQLAEAERRVRELEQQLAPRSPEVRVETKEVTIESVQAALPDGGALVEMFELQPPPASPSPRAKPDPAARRFIAYVVPKKGAVSFVDLGPVAAIEEAAEAVRRAVSAPPPRSAAPSRGARPLDPTNAPDAKAVARALDEKLLRPIRAKLGDATHLFLSPDAALNLVPFAVLVGEDDRFLLQRSTISYLTSGRDLLRFGASRPSRSRPAVIADPAFGDPGEAAAPEVESDGTSRGRRAAEGVPRGFARLPATAAEAKSVSALLPGATA